MPQAESKSTGSLKASIKIERSELALLKVYYLHGLTCSLQPQLSFSPLKVIHLVYLSFLKIKRLRTIVSQSLFIFNKT